MSSFETGSPDWIERGKEAFGRLKLAEAAQHFQQAVAINPASVEAHLCFGVASLFLYQNGVSEAGPKFFDPVSSRHLSAAEFAAHRDRSPIIIAEQNASNGRQAEANLQQTLQLDPRNKLAMEYLGALYRSWLEPTGDSLGNTRHSRLAEAVLCYKRILELYPDHDFANYVCGVIEWQQAFVFVQSSGHYPRPLTQEEDRQPLHEQITPLLADSLTNLLRAVEIDPANWYPMSYLSNVKRLQAYVAATPDQEQQALSEADQWLRKVHQLLEAKAKKGGQPWPSGPTATLVFSAVAEASQTPPKWIFPPDPRHSIPLGIPPPPMRPIDAR